MDKCAPSSPTEDNISCFSKRSLIKIAKEYNQTAGSSPVNINSSKKDIWTQLKNGMSKKCGNNEFCWTTLNFVKKLGDSEINYYTFKPKGPKGKTEWLSTTDIDNVLKQYTKVYPHFGYLGAHPVDFEKIGAFSAKSFTNKSNYGAVINMDPSTKGGSHWVGIFFTKSKPQFDYFDSVGTEPPKEVLKLINDLKGIYPNLKVNINKIDHQRSSSECGVYAINFIISRLMGKTFEYVSKHVVRDSEMNKRRKIFFI